MKPKTYLGIKKQDFEYVLASVKINEGVTII